MGDACVSTDGQLVGHCVVHELDDVLVDGLGSVFADLSVIQLDNNVVADNSLRTIDSNSRQLTCRSNSLISAVHHPSSKGVVGRVRYQTISGPQGDPFRYLSISVPHETRCRVRDHHQYRFGTTSSVPPGPLRYQILFRKLQFPALR